MNRKLFVISLSVILLVSANNIVFAAQEVDSKQIIIDGDKQVVEESAEIKNINKNFKETKNKFIVTNKDISIEIPKNSSNNVVLDSYEFEDIEMSLPNSALNVNAVMTRNGTIAYGNNKDDFIVTVQTLKQNQDEIEDYAVRSMITIKNSNAPKEYSFQFNYPKGYKLIKDNEFCSYQNEKAEGSVYIVNDENEIVNVIEPAWAIGADGNRVKTYYVIDGNKLIQVVDFNDDTVFPIVADPTSHPNRTKTYFLTKTQVKTIRDKYTNKNKYTIITGIATTLGLNGRVIAAWSVGMMLYEDYQYNKWNAWYNKMNKTSKLKVTVIERWRSGGKNSAYITDKIIFSL